MKSELLVPAFCPNVTDIQLQGPELNGDYSFRVRIFLKTDQSTAADNPVNHSVIVSGQMTRYFEPDEFTKQDYQTPITMAFS